VYGLAADPHIPDAEQRIFAAKGRRPDKPIPLLAAHETDVEKWGAVFTELDRRLAHLFWPGPLTLVLRAGSRDEGFRVPDFNVTRAILREAGGILRVTSANLSGEPPATTAEQALESLGGVVQAVVDAGPAPGGIPSTVVRVEAGQIRVIREGAISVARIMQVSAGFTAGHEEATVPIPVLPKQEKGGGKKLLVFVCTGNVCRSPMAEHLLRQRLGADPEWNVLSAGIVAADGLPPSEAAVSAMAEIGIDIRSHFSQPLTRELVNAADLIVVMTASHREQIRALYPDAVAKVRLLKSFGADTESDIEDPIGLPLEVYRAVRDQIDRAVDGLVRYLKGSQKDAEIPPGC
ncbi:MAG: Sua5/YciO/YrdC/YwlC family protein, partial [Kiritimatiellae bacterium]|nr:Sua5/YciO/YrdC/YwlC family protein [Kiritimatiellia bacterium]